MAAMPARVHGRLHQLYERVGQIPNPDDLLGIIDSQNGNQTPPTHRDQIGIGELCYIAGIGAHLHARMICLDASFEGLYLVMAQVFDRIGGSAFDQVLVLDPFEIDHVQDQVSDGEEMAPDSCRPSRPRRG